MIVYKAVKKNRDGRRLSVFAPQDGVVKYVEGRKTKPLDNCGPLCAFVSLDSAKMWARKYQFYNGLIMEIYLAEATPSSAKEIWAIYPDSAWAIDELPRGVVLCDSITLISKVM